jgi:hypothetical protein
MGFLDRILGAMRSGPGSTEQAPTGDPLRIAEVEAVLARL